MPQAQSIPGSQIGADRYQLAQIRPPQCAVPAYHKPHEFVAVRTLARVNSDQYAGLVQVGCKSLTATRCDLLVTRTAVAAARWTLDPALRMVRKRGMSCVCGGCRR